MIDCHVHTERCRHAGGCAVDYVRAAAARGIETLTFTEHLPLAPAIAERVEGAEGYAMPAHELADYHAEVARAAVLGRELGVEVLLGCEADLVPLGVDHARELIAAYPYDLVLGSVHFVGDWAFDDPDRTDGYADWDIRELWERYFADLAEAARTGLADAIAHPDLVKKFCFRPEGDLTGLYRDLAGALASAGVAVEVNSAGLRKPCAELYPGPELLRELSAAGVPATVGSDAHAPEEVGAGLTQAVIALKEAGYRSVVVFRGRQPVEVGIDEL